MKGTKLSNTIGDLPGLVPWFMLSIVFLLSAHFAPHLFTLANLFGVLRNAFPLALAALGQAIVMICGEVDLSIGALTTLVTVIGALILKGIDTRIVWSVGSALGISIGTALINSFTVVQLRVPSFIATLSTMAVLRGAVLILARGPVGAASPGLRSFVRATAAGVPTGAYLLIGVLGISVILLRYTRFGRYVIAVGGNREAARLAGIKVGRIITLSYVISGLCAALSGLYLIGRMGAGDPNVGRNLELDSIIAVILAGTPFGGGCASVLGLTGSILLLAFLNNFLALLNVSTWYNQISRALIFMAALAILKRRW
ncbi:MAG: ABC transporter permease [Candidatus Bathyarchaeia archaeon]